MSILPTTIIRDHPWSSMIYRPLVPWPLWTAPLQYSSQVRCLSAILPCRAQNQTLKSQLVAAGCQNHRQPNVPILGLSLNLAMLTVHHVPGNRLSYPHHPYQPDLTHSYCVYTVHPDVFDFPNFVSELGHRPPFAHLGDWCSPHAVLATLQSSLRGFQQW